MSSDSSNPPKNNTAQKQKSAPVDKNRKFHISQENSNKQARQGYTESQNSVKEIRQPKITILEQLSSKNEDRLDFYHREESRKETTTTHGSSAPTVITAVLRNLHDDIVRSPDYRQPGPLALVNGDTAVAVIGGDNIYVQSKTKFIAVPRDKALSTHSKPHFWGYQTSKLEEHFPLDVAILVQKIFTPISSMCFGLLGGVALLQLILVHHLVGGLTDDEWTFFLQSYSRFADLAPLLFYILLAACIASVLDRITVHQETVVWQPSWIVVVVYVVTLILTLSCASYDDMIVLYPQNKTLFQDKMKTQEYLSHWQMLNTLRCVFAILGWVLFSLTMPPDLLLKHLLQMKEYEQKKYSHLFALKKLLTIINIFNLKNV